jgi:hypothetical protein
MTSPPQRFAHDTFAPQQRKRQFLYEKYATPASGVIRIESSDIELA